MLSEEAVVSQKKALTLTMAAEQLDISTSTLHRRIADGTIRVIDLGGRVRRISQQEIDRLLDG